MSEEWQRFADELVGAPAVRRRWRRARSNPPPSSTSLVAELAAEASVDMRALSLVLIELLEGEATGSRADREVIAVEHLVHAIDHGLQRLFNAVLHHPRVASLEAVWRAVAYLAADIDRNDNVVLELLHVERSTWDAELDRAGPLRATPLHRRLLDAAHDPAEGAPAPYSLVIGLYEHGPSEAEVTRLERMGELGRRAGFVFLSDASHRMFGLDDGTLAGLGERMSEWRVVADGHEPPESLLDPQAYSRWSAFRATEASRSVGLLVGRIRLREPHRTALPNGGRYVERTSHAHDASKLGPPWSSSTVLLAGVIVRAFKQYRVAMNIIGPQSGGEIPRLPNRVPTQDGTSQYVRHECVGGSSLEYLLQLQGFISWEDHHRYGPSFLDAASCARVTPGPATREGKATEMNDRLSARLPYQMLLLRFAHHLAVIRRTHFAHMSDPAQCVQELRLWLADHVGVGPTLRFGKRPLEDASLTVTPDASGDGAWMRLSLTPRLRYMGASFTLHMDVWLPDVHAA